MAPPARARRGAVGVAAIRSRSRGVPAMNVFSGDALALGRRGELAVQRLREPQEQAAAARLPRARSARVRRRRAARRRSRCARGPAPRAGAARRAPARARAPSRSPPGCGPPRSAGAGTGARGRRARPAPRSTAAAAPRARVRRQSGARGCGRVLAAAGDGASPATGPSRPPAARRRLLRRLRGGSAARTSGRAGGGGSRSRSRAARAPTSFRPRAGSKRSTALMSPIVPA